MIMPNYSMNKKEKNSFGLSDRDMKTLQDIFKKNPESDIPHVSVNPRSFLMIAILAI